MLFVKGVSLRCVGVVLVCWNKCFVNSEASSAFQEVIRLHSLHLAN